MLPTLAMHATEFLGCCQDLGLQILWRTFSTRNGLVQTNTIWGGALALLTHHHMTGSVSENLSAILEAIKAAYDDARVPNDLRYPTLRVTQYKSAKLGTLPKLKGTGVQCKGLAKVLPDVFAVFADLDDEYHRRVLEGLCLIRETNEILHEMRDAYRLPQNAADSLINKSFNIGRIVTELIRYYHPLGIPIFHYTIKLHYTLHISLVARYTNPMMWDCSSEGP